MDPLAKMYKYEIVQLNIRGARSNNQNLEHYLSEINYPEVVCLNETKLPLNKRYEVRGYNIAARREHNAIGGSRGSMILTRDDITDIVEIEEVKDMFRNDEIIGIEIKSGAKRPNIKIFTYYNPPLTSPNDAIFSYIASLHGNCVLTGDLNCKNTHWGSTKNDARGIGLLQCLISNDLITFNNESATRCDPVTGKEESLDLIIGNAPLSQMLQEFWVGFDVGSDHYPVHVLFQFDTPTPSVPRHVRKPEKMNNQVWNRILKSQSPISSSSTPTELDTNVEILTKTINGAFESSCPLTRINKQSIHHFTPEIQTKVKEKRKLRRQKNDALQQQNFSLVREIMTKINRLGNEIKKLQKIEKKRDLERHCERLNRETNPRKFFQTFGIVARPILEENTAPSSQRQIESENGSKASTSQEKADLFADRLKHVHQEPDYAGFDNGWKVSVERFLDQNKKLFKVDKNETYSMEEDGDDSNLCQEVSIEELDANLARCKNRSAVGNDGISYHLLKKLPENMKKNVCQVFSDAIRLGYYPEKWKSATVKMIPKPNKDSRFAKNFRPISLLSCVGKVLERILANRISSFLEENNMFATSQSGFRRKRMTSEQLLRLSEECHSAFKNNKNTAAIFLDAEAAFDRCWHSGIKYKLKRNLNLPSRTIRLISSFLTERNLIVSYEGCVSQKIFLNAGTPQGSPLSPLIYIIYVNDYPENIQELGSLSQFADDTALWTQAYTRSYATSKLQKALNLLESWCRKWRVKLNGEKSHFLFFSRTRDSEEENYALHLFDDVIRPTNSAKFLGIEIDGALCFKKQINSIYDRAMKRLNVLKVLSANGTDAPTLMRLYKMYVRPIIEYGSIAFMSAPKTQLSRLEQIQNEAIRICLRLPRYIRTSLLHEYASLEPIFERLKDLNVSLLETMKSKNVHIENLVECHSRPTDNRHLSPLDNLLSS